MSALLDKRLIVVTGKGGVGKTTVAAALGLLAARSGRRTVVAEVSEQERLSALFGRRALGHSEGRLAGDLHGVSIDPARAKEEWLRYQLHSSTLAGLLGGSRLFQYLTAAAPGVDELVTIGKVWDLAQLERRVGGTRPYAEIARVGPIARQAEQIDRFISDSRLTGIVAVALPEEMPVNETIDLDAALWEELAIGVDAIVVNALLPDRFDEHDVELLARLDGRGPIAAALSEHRRARAQRAELERLRAALEAPLTTLPFLFEPELGTEQVELLSHRLEESL